MVTNQGSTVVGGHSAGTITPRLATDTLYRHAHPEPKPKPKGLDWAAHTPTCGGCHTKSGQIDQTGLCPTCRPAPVHEHTPHREKSGALACSTCLEELEPAPAPPATPRPAPSVRAKVSMAGTHHAVIAIRSMTDTPLDPVAVTALLNDLLHALHQQQGPTTTTTRHTKKSARATRNTPKHPRKPRTPTYNFDLATAQRLLNEGHSVPQIAANLGCAISTARRHLKAAGVTIPDGRTTHSGGRNAKTTLDDNPQLRDQLIARYQAGESTVQLGRAFDCTAKQVNAILRRAGVTLRPQANVGKPISDTDRTDITTAYAAGEPAIAIARRYGVKKDRIRDILEAAGLDIRGPGLSAQRALPAPARVIKTWAHSQGLIDQIRTGRVSNDLIDAYITAHPTEGATPA